MRRVELKTANVPLQKVSAAAGQQSVIRTAVDASLCSLVSESSDHAKNSNIVDLVSTRRNEPIRSVQSIESDIANVDFAVNQLYFRQSDGQTVLANMHSEYECCRLGHFPSCPFAFCLEGPVQCDGRGQKAKI